MKMEKDKKVLLELLKRNGGTIKGKTRFQIMVFLAQEEEGLDEFYEFKDYNYGPYSFELSDSLSALEEFNLIEVKRQGKKFIYSLTEKGEEAIREVKESSLKEVVDKWNDSSLRELIDYVWRI